MLRRKKDKAKVGDKVYCGECKFFEMESCEANPQISKHEYFAPGHTISTRDFCGNKNAKNDCPDFKKKATAILQKSL